MYLVEHIQLTEPTEVWDLPDLRRKFHLGKNTKKLMRIFASPINNGLEEAAKKAEKAAEENWEKCEKCYIIYSPS